MHHSKKGDTKGIDSILGSTGIAGTVDTIIFLGRTENYRIISSTQRMGEDINETVLDFDRERRWASLGGSREETEINRVKISIVDFLSRQTDAVEEKVIDEGVEGNRSYRKRALRELVKEGKVKRMGEGKKGKPYLYKNAGFLVPAIPEKPENQNFQNHPISPNTIDYSVFDEILGQDDPQDELVDMEVPS